MRKLLIIGAGVVFSSALLSACASRRDAIKTELKAVTLVEASSISKTELKLVTSFYDDTLTGMFDVDTNAADSATFESNGIRLTLKTAKGKNGKSKIDFKAIAKPVARSALDYTDTTTIAVKKVDALNIDQTSKTVLTRPHWLTGLYTILGIAVLLLMIWAYKKYRSWKKII